MSESKANNHNPKKNIHEKHRKRMRERFNKKGISGFEDHEILEFLLYYVYRTKDTNPIGHRLMDEFGTLENVFSATYDELCAVKGIGDTSASLINFLGQLRNRISLSQEKSGFVLSNTQAVGRYCIDFFADLTTERLILISMKSNREVIDVDVISDGDHSASVVDIRKIVSTALKRKAVMVVLAHNHPGDSTHPSDNDIIISRRVVNVLEGIDVAVVDHIICNATAFTSMEERGLLEQIRSF